MSQMLRNADIKVWQVEEADVHALKANVDNLASWSDFWLTPITAAKYIYIQITHVNVSKSSTREASVHLVLHYIDLGVIVSHDEHGSQMLGCR